MSKRSFVLSIILGIAVGALALAGHGAPAPADPSTARKVNFATTGRAAAQAGSTSAIDPEVVPDLFYVAIDNYRGSTACANVPGKGGTWLGSRLYPALQDDGHCRYVWQSDAVTPPAAPDRNALLSRSNLRETRPDPPVVVVEAPAAVLPLDSPDMQAWLKARHRVMRDRLGEPDPSTYLPHRATVRVAVVDSATGDLQTGFKDRLGHGETIARLIRDVACTGHAADCKTVEIKAYPGLRLRTSQDLGTQQASQGLGSYGTPGAIAQQIVQASDDWLRDRAAPGGPAHLIINLSIGWSGCFNKTPWTRDKWSADSDPVQRAVLYARCHGALVIASAGNIEAVPGCPKAAGWPDDKPVERTFPAQFANALPPPPGGDPIRATPPTPASCQQIGVSTAPVESMGSLMLGIGAVDEFDVKLAVAAQEATLVSHANTVSAPDPVHGGFRNNLSGTSMSTATVSGIAAAVWATFPSHTPAELERHLIEPAVVLGPRDPSRPFLCNKLPASAQPAIGDECEVVRRASLCRSLAHAAGLPSQCGPEKFELTPVPWPLQKAPAPVLENRCPDFGGAAGPCEPANARAIDSTEQPWGFVAPTPPGDSCGTCAVGKIASPRVFSARFVSGGAVDSRNGYLQFGSGRYALWGELGAPSLDAALCPTPDVRAGGLLHYVKKTAEGEVHDYESIVIELDPQAPPPDGSECAP